MNFMNSVYLVAKKIIGYQWNLDSHRRHVLYALSTILSLRMMLCAFVTLNHQNKFIEIFAMPKWRRITNPQVILRITFRNNSDLIVE